MTLIVADASAIVEFLLGTSIGAVVTETITRAETDLHVPALCDVEVTAALRRGLADRRLTETRAREAVTDYLDLPLTRHGHTVFLPRLLELRANFTVYDATYVALAEQLNAALLTADRRLERAARAHLDLELRSPWI